MSKSFTVNKNKFSLRSIILENFRGYLKESEIKFGRKLTLIFGKGSSGKSTILEAVKCLADSNLADTDLANIKTKHILSKKSKTRDFKLGCSVSEGSFSRAFFKKFELTDGEFIPSQIDLHSFSEKEKDGTPIPSTLFASIKNSKISKKHADNLDIAKYYRSQILYCENEYAYKEMYAAYMLHRKELSKNLLKCKDFAKKFMQIKEEQFKDKKSERLLELNLDKIKNKPQTEKIKKEVSKKRVELEKIKLRLARIDTELDGIFSTTSNNRQFNPLMFVFRELKNIDNYIVFLKKEVSFKEFVKYLSDDIKREKHLFYNNLQLYPLRRVKKRANIFHKDEKELGRDWDTLCDFMCSNLSQIILNEDSYYPSKEHFTWNKEVQGKTINVKAMFLSCSDMFKGTLKKIKLIRNVEIIQMLANTFTNINLDNPHALIEQNQKTINKWLEQFGYDFKVSVERTGVSDESEIVHRKGGYRIPSSQGGSGAQYLLTFLSSCVGFNEAILLLEEPEKGLHPSLQVKLANFFVENSKQNQLIVETHSENLLLGVLKNIREKKLDPEDIKINYVYMENGESKVDEIKVDKQGNFKSKWRHGFFTEKLDLI